MYQQKLWNLIHEKHITQRSISKTLGISEKQFAAKMYGKTDFRFSEVVAICRILGIENPLDVFEARDQA